MFRQVVKSLAVGGMVVVTTATTVFAQIPLQKLDLQLSQVSSFKYVLADTRIF